MTVAELLVPADDEVALVDELAARTGLHWGTRIPNPLPEEFGRVVSTGGTERDLVTDSPTLTVEAFALTEGRARRVCAEAVAHLQAAAREGRVGDVVCHAVRAVSLPANLPMPSVPGRFRFTATVSADLRRTS